MANINKLNFKGIDYNLTDKDAQQKIEQIQSNLESYETKENAAATYQPKGDYLTEHQDLSEYAKTSEVESKIAEATTDMATKEDVANAIEELDLEETLSDYVKSEDLENQLADKADKSEIPSLEGYATESYVDGKVSAVKDEIVGGASGAYDTLKEIEDYINNHGEAAAALNAEIAKKADKTELDNYIEKKEGYDLSKNDFTDELKEKLQETPKFVVVETREELDSINPKDENTFYYVAGESVEYLTEEVANELYQPKGNYLTEHQSLEGYYTKTEIDSKVSDIETKINAIPSFWVGTQEQYDSINPKDDNTFYFINE